MNGLASAVQRASETLQSERTDRDSVVYTARSSSNGATVFLSCHLKDQEADYWECAPVEEAGIAQDPATAIIECESIRSQNRFHCKVLGKVRSSW